MKRPHRSEDATIHPSVEKEENLKPDFKIYIPKKNIQDSAFKKAAKNLFHHLKKTFSS